MSGEANLAGTKLGNYLLQKMIGRGHMGVVYLALDEALLRPTAVKVLSASEPEHDLKAWFLSEARSVAKLNHASVIQIYSVARQGPYRYIAMEYVEGASADVMVARQGPFSPERATSVILQLAGALELAHTSGIIHRDVKPANILIKSDGAAKLGDFGMAVSSNDSHANTRAGTPHYFAPEIWRGESASIASDLYALGATYYYLLSGRPPFTAESIAELGIAHQQREIPPLAELPTEVAPICMRLVKLCMARSAIDRPKSAQAVAWEARGVLRDLEAASRSRRGGAAEANEAGPRAAGSAWRTMGFEHEPFGEVDPGALPYHGAPFEELRGKVRANLQPGSTILLSGAPGSGRTTLARSLLASWRGERCYISLDGEDGRGDSLIDRVTRAFGAAVRSDAGGAAAIEGLLEALSSPAAEDQVPLAVVDGVRSGTRAAAELAQLARAARSTHYFSLLVVGDLPLAADLREPSHGAQHGSPTGASTGKTMSASTGAAAGASMGPPASASMGPPASASMGPPASASMGASRRPRPTTSAPSRPRSTSVVIEIPPLALSQVRAYLTAWLRATLSSDAPALLLTTDAALLLGQKSGGNLKKLNALTRRMLLAQPHYIFTSWQAWLASETPRASSTGSSNSNDESRGPSDWPPPQILQLLNQARRAAGIAERSPPLALETPAYLLAASAGEAEVAESDEHG